jgi:hypothetical protein
VRLLKAISVPRSWKARRALSCVAWQGIIGGAKGPLELN